VGNKLKNKVTYNFYFSRKVYPEFTSNVKIKQVEHDGQFTLIKWMLGILIAGVFFSIHTI